MKNVSYSKQPLQQDAVNSSSTHMSNTRAGFDLAKVALPCASIILAASALMGCQSSGEVKMQQQPSAEQAQALNMEAKKTIKPFAEELLGTVKLAVASGGHEKAIDTCQNLAPAITNKHGQGAWQLKRTSTQVRNPNNAADAWEAKVLADFAKRAAAGEPLQTMEYGEQVGEQYRYAKAIGIKKPCLACHGENIKPEVQAMLNKTYPEDAATGYKMGELRGMFSLSKNLQH